MLQLLSETVRFEEKNNVPICSVAQKKNTNSKNIKTVLFIC